MYQFKSRLNNKNKIIIVKYEDLRKNQEKILKKVCHFLNLDFELNLLNQPYKPNTSFNDFNSEEEQKSVLTKFEIFMIKKSAFFSI
ncbi:MAG: sulfotransferase domain-containing protein [Promethearchaeota archaeon]